MIKVLVVDDHTLFRQGVINLLNQVDDVDVVGEAGSGTDALQLAAELTPDVIVMDIMMKGRDGISTTRELQNTGSSAKVVLVTMYREWHFIERARNEAKIDGYVLKQDAFEDLVHAVRMVADGGTFFSPSLASELGIDADAAGGAASLTERERQILVMIAEGYSSQAIASQLFVSIKTVETHRRHISQKLDLHGPADFTRFAIKVGLVQP